MTSEECPEHIVKAKELIKAGIGSDEDREFLKEALETYYEFSGLKEDG